MYSDDLSPESRDLLLHVSSLSVGAGWVNLKGLSTDRVSELVHKGLLEYRSGSRKWKKLPSSVVLTSEGRKLATQLRKGTDQSESPQTWRAPEWHVDFGDPVPELNHLRSFALALMSYMPNVKLDLQIPEPGLMYVQLEMENGTVAEVYSNPAPELGSRLFAMFFWPGTGREQEVYAASVEVAVASCFEPPVE